MSGLSSAGTSLRNTSAGSLPNTRTGQAERPRHETLLTLPTGTSRAVFQVGFTRGGLVFKVLFKDTDPTVNLARLTALHTEKDQFEQALGEEAEWDQMAGSKAARMYVTSPLGDVVDVIGRPR